MRAPVTDKHLLEMMWERFPEIMKRGAEQPTQQCKWPTCQSEEYQQALAEQIEHELVGGQPAQRTWVGLTDEEVTKMPAWIYSPDQDGMTAEEGLKAFARAIEAKLKEKNT